MIQIQKYFEENSYVVIENFLSKDLLKLCYQYTKTKASAIDFKISHEKDVYHNEWDGTFADEQVSNSYSCYGDSLMDSILYLSLEKMQEYTGKKLVPTYSYWRLYFKDQILERHIDRPSCEISTTVCLGYDASNIDKEKYPDYKWPIWIEHKDSKKEIPINLNPGDMLIYRGCEVEHWRDAYLGLNHSQVFLHYNEKDGPYNNLFDGRPLLGIPSYYKKG